MSRSRSRLLTGYWTELLTMPNPLAMNPLQPLLAHAGGSGTNTMADEFAGENRRNGDRFLFEQLSRLQKDFHTTIEQSTRILAKEMNEQRERHHTALNELSGVTLNHYLDVRDQLGEVKAQVTSLTLQFNEHTHPEILMKQEAIHRDITEQLERLEATIITERAEMAGAAKQRTSTKGIIAWTLGAIGAVLTVITATIGIIQAMT